MKIKDLSKLDKKKKDALVPLIAIPGGMLLCFILIMLGRPISGPIVKGVLAPLLFVAAFIALCLCIIQYYRFWSHGKLNGKRALHFVWEIILMIAFCYLLSDDVMKGWEFWKELIINHVNIFAQ